MQHLQDICTFDTGPFDDADDAMLRDRMAILHKLGLPRTFQIACAEQKPVRKTRQSV